MATAMLNKIASSAESVEELEAAAAAAHAAVDVAQAELDRLESRAGSAILDAGDEGAEEELAAAMSRLRSTVAIQSKVAAEAHRRATGARITAVTAQADARDLPLREARRLLEDFDRKTERLVAALFKHTGTTWREVTPGAFLESLSRAGVGVDARIPAGARLSLERDVRTLERTQAALRAVAQGGSVLEAAPGMTLAELPEALDPTSGLLPAEGFSDEADTLANICEVEVLLGEARDVASMAAGEVTRLTALVDAGETHEGTSRLAVALSEARSASDRAEHAVASPRGAAERTAGSSERRPAGCRAGPGALPCVVCPIDSLEGLERGPGRMTSGEGVNVTPGSDGGNLLPLAVGIEGSQRCVSASPPSDSIESTTDPAPSPVPRAPADRLNELPPLVRRALARLVWRLLDSTEEEKAAAHSHFKAFEQLATCPVQEGVAREVARSVNGYNDWQKG